MKQYIVDQNYSNYTAEDHEVWRLLCDRQSQLNESIISNVYLQGYKDLKIDRKRIPVIKEVSDRLEEISGWTLVPVSGLLPTRDFFYMLIKKSYPITASIRKMNELDFSEQPDIFHDICGHLPLLTNERFVKFLTRYCIIAIKYAQNERATEFLGRLYWYTYEMGLINENGKNKPYGGAVLTSSSEIKNVYSERVTVHPWDLDKVFQTVYNPFDLQREYFFIDSFDDLFQCLESVEDKLLQLLTIPYPSQCLINYSLNKKLGTEFNNVIGFLNDTQFRYPNAISFVAGQPDERFFNVESNVSKFDEFVTYKVEKSGRSKDEVLNQIGQYARTGGMINDMLSSYLKNDEAIHVSEEDILVTAGAQEAFSIIVSTICNKDTDAILAEDPSYIGLSSFAKVFGYDIQGVPIDDEDGIDLFELRKKILEISRQQKKLKLVYVIPDHQNPTGCCMSIGSRLKLLELAEQYNFLIIEDSVYNSFTYRQQRIPSLKALDKNNRVIYVGSFSKSIFPGLRIGLIAANQKLENQYGEIVRLIQEMTKIKAQITNNTSAISQAILGGILVSNNFSLSQFNEEKFKSYEAKLDQMLESLDAYIGVFKDGWAANISWTTPRGGFFIKLSVPFEVGRDAVTESADKFGIIFCPMSFFYLNGGGNNEIRVTFSNLTLEQIDRGVKKLSEYLKYMVSKDMVDFDVTKTEVINSYN